MTPPSGASLCGAATVFVVQDVVRSVEHYCDVLGFKTVLETIKGGTSGHRLPAVQAADAGGVALSCAASAKCFAAMADIGARMIGQEVHRH